MIVRDIGDAVPHKCCHNSKLAGAGVLDSPSVRSKLHRRIISASKYSTVSDVQITNFLRVSEFTSDSGARERRHSATLHTLKTPNSKLI